MLGLPRSATPYSSQWRTDLALLERYLKHNLAFAIHDHRDVFLGALRCLQAYAMKPIGDTRILEIGCGQRFGVTLLFHSLGATVVGIDLDVPVRLSWSGLRALLGARGARRAAKSVVRKLVFDGRYYAALQREFGQSLQFNGLDIRRMDACELAFDDASFDYVFSNAVFEHIADVDTAISEVARVLVPDGIARISVHLFPSLSGGHHPDWAYPDQRPSVLVPPWDHLRTRQHPASVYLNQLRATDFLTTFRQHLDVLSVSSLFEGHHYLTAEIRDELLDYSDRDLLTRSITVVMQKKPRD